MAEYKSPYAARIAALSGERETLAGTPLADMYSPEEAAARKLANSRMMQMAVLNQLTGDKVLGNVGEPMLKQSLTERQRKITEHGEFDPLTGNLKVFPEYTRRKKEDALEKEQTRMRELDAAAQAAWDRQQERSEDRKEARKDRAALAGANTPGSYQAGQDFTPAGEPIVFHNKSGRFYTVAKDGTHVPYDGPRISRADFGKESAVMDKHVGTGTRIDQIINRIDQNKSAFGGGYGGAAVSLLPESVRGIASNQVFTMEEQKLRADVYEEAYQVAKELAGTAQSMNESMRLEPFTPRPGDPYEVVLSKMQAAQTKHAEMLGRLQKKRAAGSVSHQPGPEVQKQPATDSPKATPTPSGGKARLSYDPVSGELK